MPRLPYHKDMERSRHFKPHKQPHDSKDKKKRFQWERSRSRDNYEPYEAGSRTKPSHSNRHYSHFDHRPPSPPKPYNNDSLHVQTALPNLLQTLQRYRTSQAQNPPLRGLIQSEVLDLMAAQLQLKSFLLKLAVDIDDYYVDHHNQLNCEAEVKLWRTHEQGNTRERVRLYHCVLHVDERRGIVHALDVLEFGTKECPCALRLCHQKDH